MLSSSSKSQLGSLKDTEALYELFVSMGVQPGFSLTRMPQATAAVRKCPRGLAVQIHSPSFWAPDPSSPCRSSVFLFPRECTAFL